jgi:hypothetical protein
MSVPDFQAAVRQWLSDATGAEVINGHGSGPKPALSFATVSLTTAIPRGHPDRDPLLGTQNTREHRQEFRASMSVQFFGPQAKAHAFAAREALALDATLEKFRAVNVAVQATGGVNNIPVIVNAGWESRYQMDVFLGFRGAVSEALYWIEKLEDATYTMFDSSGSVLKTGTFDVP